MILPCIIAAALAIASTDDLTGAILLITGTAEAEELDEQTFERFQSLHEHPVDLNACGRSRLLASGLMSEYQVVSLLDYRSRNGDVLSWSELALVDGFSPALAEALSHFCHLTTPSMWPPAATVLRGSILPATRSTIMAKSGVKFADNGDASICYGAKCNVELGDMLEVNWGSRTTYSDGRFGPGTASMAYYGRQGKIVVGDFNARYGQGLCQWSGFSMSSYSSVTAMMRKATGISASKSFTRTLHGAAADIDIGQWNIGGAWGWPGIALAHAERYGKKVTAGMTASIEKDRGANLAADWRIGSGNLCFYGEAMLDSKDGARALAGLMRSPVYGTKEALLCKWSDGSFQTVAGYQNKIITSTFDAIWKDSYKGLLIVKPSFVAGEFELSPALRAQYKYKLGSEHPSRLELRAEAAAKWKEEWAASARYDWVMCKGKAWLWYAELGRKAALSAYLRFSLFKIDNWDDRIWVYERDAPGNFNVPAYYGRGFATSVVLSYKCKKQCLHLRTGTVRYPWNLQDKSPKTEVKLQYQLKL